MEERQKEEHIQEAEEHKRERGEIKPLIQEKKQMQEHTAAERNILQVGTVHVKGPIFDRSAHLATYLWQFEAAACANNTGQQ